MLENTWYSVISPESCSSILWRNWDNKETAAEALKLTPNNMLKNKMIDYIIKEPLGGAHQNKEKTFETVKDFILEQLIKLKKINSSKIVDKRIEKFCKMGIKKS
jgi:acetyl-CoA carboxylase carboxyl transferase subunit alpha